MKGIIFNLVEDVVCARHGEDVWDRLLGDAGLEGGYASIGDYPDEHLHALVRAASAALGVTTDEVLVQVGHGAVLGLSERYPRFFEPHRRSLDFVLTLNDVIHPEVRKIHRHADPPEFDFSRLAEDELRIGYRSRRGLCVLAEGMLGGAADYYGERAEVRHEQCTHRGDPGCVLRCRFVRPDGPPDVA